MRNVVIATLLLLAFGVHAQTEPEYRLEVGGGLGLVSYQGDFNGNIFKNQQPMFTALAKYRFDPRRALAMNVSYGHLKGSARDVQSYIPAEWQDYSFNYGLLDVGFRYEYNFWPYGTGMEYRGAKRITPYVFIGVGITMAKARATEFGMNLPIGVGVKYKVADRVNMALEWAMHFNTNDWVDGAKDPYGVSSSGLFKNTDCYSHLRVSLTYDLWAKCRTCHNDRD